MKLKKIINGQRERRKFRVRKVVRGTAERPRLSVSRSLKHFAVQAIDDEAGRTLFSASTKDKSFGDGHGSNCEAAKKVGAAIAERAKSAGVKMVCLDRGSCKYHGRVAAFADAVREAGIEL
jgi:large subunit ribosomal protein L18